MTVESRSGDEAAGAQEALLVSRSKQGDRQAFNQLVLLHQSAAYSVAMRMLGDPDTAADVTQDAFLSAYRSIQSFRGQSFRGWLLRIVTNGCYDHWRSTSRRPTVSIDVASESDDSHDSPGYSGELITDPEWAPERIALRTEQVESIQRALLRLSPDQRMAVILCDIEGMPYEEIAQVMDTSAGTVKSRIFRGRQHLRSILRESMELIEDDGRPPTRNATEPRHNGES